MKKNIALALFATALLIGSGISIDATEKSKINDSEAVQYIDKAYDTTWLNKSVCFSSYSSAITDRQILDELRTMNKTLTEINNKLNN